MGTLIEVVNDQIENITFIKSYSDYEEFLNRYLEIVPDYSFGLGKKELLPNKDLKEFLGY